MINIICLLFPALFSVFTLERLLGKKLSLHNFLFIFVTNTLAINIVSIFFFYSFTGDVVMQLWQEGGIRATHSCFYMGLSVVVALLGVLVEVLYFNRLRIGFKDHSKDNKSGTSDKKDADKE